MTGLSFDNRMLLHHEPSSSCGDGGSNSREAAGGEGGEEEQEQGGPAEDFVTRFPNSLESETDPPAASTVNDSFQEAGEEDRNAEDSQADFAPSGRVFDSFEDYKK